MDGLPTRRFSDRISDRWFYILCGTGFVLSWSSGFVGGKISAPYIEPLTLLLYRYILTVPILALFALVTGATWPKDLITITRICITGILFHVLYLGGVYIAMAEGLPAGIAALIAGLQPVLTAIISHMVLENKLTTRQWLGVAIGFGAILLIVDLSTGGAGGPGAYAWAIVGTLSITVGALFQKRYCADVPMASSLTLQFGAALLALSVIVPVFGSLSADWSGELVFAYFWLIFVTSFGSYSLIYLLIRRGQVMNFASLFYFTPAATMIIAYLVYGEQISQRGYLGLILAIFSIYLINGKTVRQESKELRPDSSEQNGNTETMTTRPMATIKRYFRTRKQ